MGDLLVERPGKYDVWATDYETYSLVYSCRKDQSTNKKVENAFILSRNKTLDSINLANLKKMLSSNGFDVSKLIITQQDCE